MQGGPPTGHEAREGIVLDGLIPQGSKDVSGPNARTEHRFETVPAVVAQPDGRVGEHSVLRAPLSLDHLLAGKKGEHHRAPGCRLRNRWRTGSTSSGPRPRSMTSLMKPTSGWDQHGISHVFPCTKGGGGEAVEVRKEELVSAFASAPRPPDYDFLFLPNSQPTQNPL